MTVSSSRAVGDELFVRGKRWTSITFRTLSGRRKSETEMYRFKRKVSKSLLHQSGQRVMVGLSVPDEGSSCR